MIFLTLSCILLILLPSCVHSELPPQVYENWKLAAQEVLFIQASEVESLEAMTDYNECIKEEHFLVTATVLEVNRTSMFDGFEQGDTIKFETYNVSFDPAPECQGWSGPSWPVQVDIGWCGTVYLNHTNSSTLYLAAGGRSLETKPCNSVDDFGSSSALGISEGLLSTIYGLTLGLWIGFWMWL